MSNKRGVMSVVIAVILVVGVTVSVLVDKAVNKFLTANCGKYRVELSNSTQYTKRYTIKEGVITYSPSKGVVVSTPNFTVSTMPSCTT